jgi:2-C-methyl-D-erythritol 4-phosphate cytidylyltransferase
MEKSREFAIIVAGGSGSRMNHNIPKQFLRLGPLPVLMLTILAFYNYSRELSIILVIAEKDQPYWNALCRKFNFNYPLKIARGGLTRFQSVRNGLELIDTDGIVAIHDGVRPLVDKDIIAASFRIASEKGSAVATVPLKDSIRETIRDKSHSVDRSRFSVIQTPQTFRVPLIKNAYKQGEIPEFTDDASVAEKAGISICLFEGSYANIKITTPEDLIIARALLKTKS